MTRRRLTSRATRASSSRTPARSTSIAIRACCSAPPRVLEGSGADVIAPDDVDGVAAVLRRHYEEFAAGVRPRAVGADGRFSRARQGALMLDHLERLAGQR